MDKVLNEFFERLRDEGVQSHYSINTGKIYISVSKNEDTDKIRPLLKKYRLRLSFIDSANSNVILENRIGENDISVNSESMLLTAGASSTILQAETMLNNEGLTIGYYFPPVLASESMTFADWLKNSHIPSLNYYNRDLSGNIRGIKGIFTDGSRFETINAPRMAAGPDVIRLLLLAGQNLFSPTGVTIRINKLKNDINILSFSSQKIKNLFSALASLALKNVRIEFATLYTREDEHSDPVLEIGYNTNGLYDFKNWIIRTVNNEGASLINTVSDYKMIRDRLAHLTKSECQIEIHAKYRSIGRLSDILKQFSQNVNLKSYLYRYEKGSFSIRVILPKDPYSQIKDNILAECSKYRGDIRLTECSKSSSDEIPLPIYSRIIHSCS